MARQGKNWCFTLNNYTEEQLKDVREAYKKNGMRYLAFEKETGEVCKTPHLQGFMGFNTNQSLPAIKKMGGWFAIAHLEIMHGSISQNEKYCSKEGSFEKYGEFPMSKKEQGKFGHLAPDIWSHLTDDIKEGMNYKDLAEKYPALHGLYPKGFREKFELFAPKPVFDITKVYTRLFAWQTALLSIVEEKADKRHILWIWSKMGKVGKSDMVKHLYSTKGFEPLQNGKSCDVACAWKGGNVVFDYSRSQQDSGFINYDVIEHIKNGMLFSSKYDSRMKHSENWEPLHVICMSNSPPDISKLSSDRWQIYEIQDNENKDWIKQIPVLVAFP